MRVLITGATGFIGKNLSGSLLESGHEIIALTRNVENAGNILGSGVQCIHWDGQTTEAWQEYIEETDVVVNLAGENLAEGPWSESYRKRILNSRIQAGAAISEAILKAKRKPKLLLQASAIGFYGSRGEEELNESSQAGNGFLTEVVKQWEGSVREVESALRVVYLRSGVVLGRGEGMIGKMWLPFQLFLGGAPGSGKQWLSWIHIADEVNAMRFLMENEKLKGVFNLTSPKPVRINEFAKQFGRALDRPSWAPIPGLAIKLLFGQMGEETILSSQNVTPGKLLEAGYAFLFPEITSALADLFD